jgi:hypothetical protein
MQKNNVFSKMLEFLMKLIKEKEDNIIEISI